MDIETRRHGCYDRAFAGVVLARTRACSTCLVSAWQSTRCGFEPDTNHRVITWVVALALALSRLSYSLRRKHVQFDARS